LKNIFSYSSKEILVTEQSKTAPITEGPKATAPETVNSGQRQQTQAGDKPAATPNQQQSKLLGIDP
jgi:hypothetical protein